MKRFFMPVPILLFTTFPGICAGFCSFSPKNPDLTLLSPDIRLAWELPESGTAPGVTVSPVNTPGCFESLPPETARDLFPAGEGTKKDPYQVITAEDLNNIRHYPGAH